MRFLFSLALFFAFTPMNCVAADNKPMKNFEFTIACASAVSVALEDLRSSFQDMDDSIFKQRFDNVSCGETHTEITIRFYPSSPEIRGGAMRYLIDASTFEIIERDGER